MRVLPVSERLKSRIIQSKPVQLIIRTFLKWEGDECSEMGAALAYYGIFSLFPLLLVILSIAGFFLGSDTDVYNQLLRLAQSSLPPEAYSIVKSTLLHLNQSSIRAGLISFFLLLFTASNFFGALDRFVERIWQVRTRHQTNNNLIASALKFLKGRLSALGLVMGTAVLMLLSLLSDIALQVILKIVDEFDQSIDFMELDSLGLLYRLEKGTLFLLLSVAMMVLFKILPSTPVAWGDVWLGAVITVALFTLLQYLVSNSIIELGSEFLSYGVIGSVMVLMLWIYLTCQLFFWGSEFTYVYAHLCGSRRQRRVESPAPNRLS